MATKVLSCVKEFFNTLRALQEDKNNDSCTYEDEIRIWKKDGNRIAALSLDYGDQEVFICEKTVPKLNDSGEESSFETSNCTDGDVLTALQPELAPQPLTIRKARQLLSWYTLSQNANVHSVDDPALRPLWVRCDMSDPARTIWFGAEGVCVANKVCGVKLYSVTFTGPVVNKSALITLDELKREHKKRHHPSTMAIKGNAKFVLLGSTVVENTTIESQSSVTVDFTWSHVESVLETPPLSSTATLNIKVASGDTRTPMFAMFRELQFLQILADGLRTGKMEWLDPLESKSAVDLTKEYLEELQSPIKLQQEQASKPAEIHRDNSSSLSKLILQSYHQKIERVSLTGLTPVQMLLEMGLDKMRKDYFNYLIEEELTTANNLCYYLSTEVDLQEQFVRLKKLHHLLEIVVTCTTFLGLPKDRLLLLTKLCLQHYKISPYNEKHEFKLKIKPELITHFYQKEHPAVWGVDVSSGQGPHKVTTSLKVSDRPLVDHVISEGDYSNETANDDSTEPVCFSTLVCCSLVNFA
ncbi:protein zwilch homolog isoform X3 [Phyllopteryx taeniolatus]|uniref:protein zwilch homolog isoform X3 n=1 Tax=Phyllopteryx taeniolatus TaxID=161469 RepID=UPI002AD24AF1|nr:protein zwilch homolog isoform X3 [Phyllopteryx taeniolatus]